MILRRRLKTFNNYFLRLQKTLHVFEALADQLKSKSCWSAFLGLMYNPLPLTRNKKHDHIS